MTSQNILIGIDLGTTNSEIGINLNGRTEIIKNNHGDEYTPSVFGIDRTKNKIVGKKAYERMFKSPTPEDISNVKAEVKRLMGTDERTTFDRIGKSLNPEEISSEILKDLLTSVKRRFPEEVFNAAVITIPAAFSTLQSEATKRAGELAGLQYVVLLQEPIAAAIAYGFGNNQNQNWLIYDLGGGTFDTAVVSNRNGLLSVLAHNGDNFLGGKNIDFEIVDKVIIPVISKEFQLRDFTRGNKGYLSQFHQIKVAAESAKINLSMDETAYIEIDLDIQDLTGKTVQATIPIGRKQFEELVSPMIEATIKTCQRTIQDAGLQNSDINKIVMVGGPTMMPIVRRKLEEKLKIKVDSSVDPLTIVAKGATIFALSQKIPANLLEIAPTSTSHSVYSVELNFESLTSETNQTITGTVKGLPTDDGEFTIQILSEDGSFSGRRILLNQGRFLENLSLIKNTSNVFKLYLYDSKGDTISLQPNSFTITSGLAIAGTPIPHTLGLEVAKKDFESGFQLVNIFEPIFQKGQILPLKSQPEVFKTTRQLSKGESINPLSIRALEGESAIPDRNTYICELGIFGTELPYDLPKGSDIEITLEVSESRELTITAFIPLFDATFMARSTVRDVILQVNDLAAELEEQKTRAERLSKGCSPDEKRVITEHLKAVEVSVNNAQLDEDERRKANKQLKDIKISLDALERDKTFSQHVDTFNEGLERAKKVVDDLSIPDERPQWDEMLEKIEDEGKKAIANNDKVLLARMNELLEEFTIRVMLSNPIVWVWHFEKLAESTHYTDIRQANYIIQKGKLAVENQDFDEVRDCCRQLVNLLPDGDEDAGSINSVAGIMR